MILEVLSKVRKVMMNSLLSLMESWINFREEVSGNQSLGLNLQLLMPPSPLPLDPSDSPPHLIKFQKGMVIFDSFWNKQISRLAQPCEEKERRSWLCGSVYYLLNLRISF